MGRLSLNEEEEVQRSWIRSHLGPSLPDCTEKMNQNFPVVTHGTTENPKNPMLFF